MHQAMLITSIALLTGLLLAPGRSQAADANAVAEVRLGVGSEVLDRRFDFAAILLEHALAADDFPAQVISVRGMTQRRSMQAALGGSLDVVILPNSTNETAGLRAIPFPIRRGLLGVRLLLSRPADANRIAHVDTLETLKKQFVLGYGHDWLDAEVMQRLGFRMETANGYRNLFDMLRGGRFDYLSRGVNEIAAERGDPALAGTGMVVVPDIALFYPLDDYFVLPTRNAMLAARIERGLNRMLADGRYNRLLETHFGEAMRAAQLDQRSIIHVLGYPVPEGTPLEHFDVLQPVRSRAIFQGPGDHR